VNTDNKVLHRTAIPLRSISAGELGVRVRTVSGKLKFGFVAYIVFWEPKGSRMRGVYVW